MTALHVAAQNGRVDLVRYLLDKGAKTDIADNDGRKAINLLASAVPRNATAPPDGSTSPAAPPARGGGANAAANAAEIRALLEAAKK
jgi:hypothetical protein